MLNDFARKFVARSRHQKITESMYRSVLRRHPSPAERISTAVNIQIPGQFEPRLAEMIDSDEFKIRRLPGLIAESTKEWTGSQVFFLHIPKTAGTSVRIALIKAVGVPAFELYGRDKSMRDLIRQSDKHFWPLFVGHSNISFFPLGYSGITIFRESRSRVLSLYRQKCRAAIIDNPLDINQIAFQEKRKIALKLLSTPFGEWLNVPSQLSSIDYFIPSKQFRRNSQESNGFQVHILSLSSNEIEKLLNESISRFTHAAWSHNEPAILKAISGVSGREITDLPRENVYPNLEGYPPQILDKDALVKLNAIQEKEAVIFKIAHEHGLIPLLSKSEADDLFEITAKRLGFTFG